MAMVDSPQDDEEATLATIEAVLREYAQSVGDAVEVERLGARSWEVTIGSSALTVTLDGLGKVSVDGELPKGVYPSKKQLSQTLHDAIQ